MKKYFLLLIFVFTTLVSFSQQVTTYYLIRHAEKVRKDKTNENPELNEKGLERAKKWSEVFKNVSFDAIYSTQYKRTVGTAMPTSEAQNLEIQFYNPRDMFNKKFEVETHKKTVLVVGHSNTTPFFVNAILGEEKYQQIDDNNNANLYIVTVVGVKKTSTLLKID
ncbi:histidine phosphatase superfamily protein (branch 1) [Lutibacter sp. Hel_I_33_5]|uniref:SixA phosphatase family protein n=1 Tax=Lutibacter sp. Hel_I_33_5 TaxID=1566289 RepID=UPI0011A47EA1|nr:phosphoglycerate mutase family protein [Lutibacter sp. Hel_I_33_5]TVZ54946.1 histidine phosphatase superfamily protein (branch 1) [Lutibacter sp. Hel_I_33_5]